MSIIPFPKYPSKHGPRDIKARSWLGPLFDNFTPPIMWRDKYYETLQPPNSVTFPICAACGHIIWDWPHYEEEVPKECICDNCADEDVSSYD